MRRRSGAADGGDEVFDAGAAVYRPLLERAAILLAGVVAGLALGRAVVATMKPAPFRYEAPRSLDGALRLLGRRDAKALAGGQSLVPLLNFRLARPALLVDLNPIAELAYLRRSGGMLRIGALTRQATLERSGLVRAAGRCSCRPCAWSAIPAIRSRGTVGGSVAHADPSAELPVALAALDARFHLRSPRGERGRSRPASSSAVR